MVRRRDFGTFDMFREYAPPKPVHATIDPDIIKGNTLDVQIARALSHAMSVCGKTRSEIAGQMSERLGQKVTENMLDTYASPARRDHKITLERFMALIAVTGCYDLLAFVCGPSGFVAVPERYAEVIELWRLDREIEERLARRDTYAAKTRNLR